MAVKGGRSLAHGRMSLEFSGFEELKKKLESLNADIKPITEEAMIKSFEIVTAKAEKAIVKPKLPAQGKYSHDGLKKSLQRTPKIVWKGTEIELPVGFDISHGGLPSIFMMYGTPRYMKSQELYDAFYGERTEGEIANIQREVFTKALERIING